MWRHPGGAVGMETSSPPPPPQACFTPTQLSTVSCQLPGACALTNTHVYALSTHTYTCTDAATLPAPRTRGGRGQRQRLAGGREAGGQTLTCRQSHP